jgi:hypothetical protein
LTLGADRGIQGGLELITASSALPEGICMDLHGDKGESVWITHDVEGKFSQSMNDVCIYEVQGKYSGSKNIMIMFCITFLDNMFILWSFMGSRVDILVEMSCQKIVFGFFLPGLEFLAILSCLAYLFASSKATSF